MFVNGVIEVDEPGYIFNGHDFTFELEPVFNFIDDLKPIYIKVSVMKEQWYGRVMDQSFHHI